jgi:Spy/CpxP family protein refolding chaperone
MKTKLILLTLALAGSISLLPADNTQPAGGKGQPPQGGQGGIHILPRGAKEKLNLTDDQQKQITDLENDVKTKLESILTPAQMDQLKQMRPPQGGQGGGRRPPQNNNNN